MKTSFKLAALAAALGMAMTAQAADITLYGSVSTGLVVKHTAAAGTKGEEGYVAKQTSYGMESGWYGDSNWGITGGEELGNGWKVGFTLESNFNSDDGSMGEAGRIFDSQSYLTIGNDFVTLAAGRVGALSSGGGDFDLLGGFDPLEAKFGIGGMGVFVTRDLVANNTLAALVTPVQGLTLAGAISSGVEDDAGRWVDNVHYHALAAHYEVDALAASLIYERVRLPEAQDVDVYSFGLSYDFGVIKPMLAYQYGKHVTDLANETLEGLFAGERGKTQSMLLGVTAPVFGGNLMVSVQHFGAKYEESGEKLAANVFGIGYDYPLSKRTSLYTGATYAKGGKGLKKGKEGSAEFNSYAFGVGLKHTF